MLEKLQSEANLKQSSLSQRIASRLSPESLRSVRHGDLAPCKRLRFFMQYSDTVATQLLRVAQYVPSVMPQTRLFNQGDLIDYYCVIVRGTVKIEQKAARYLDKPDMPPIVVRTCYDGDHFGDQMFFTARIGQSKPPQTEEQYIK